jgi:hypothetical protein
MMKEVIRGTWAGVIFNGEFICVETRSGYQSGTHTDPKGSQNFLEPNASDEAIGLAVRDALGRSRFVLGVPRADVWIHPDVEFDPELYDYKLNMDRYEAWTKALMVRFGCKTKRALFKDMENCAIEATGELIKIIPKRHVKLEAWEGLGPNNAGAVEIPADSSPAEIGAALRLAFTRCTE